MVNSTLPDEEFVLTLMQIDEAKSVAEEVAGEANALNNLAGSVLKLSEKVEHDHSFLEREANQIDAAKIGEVLLRFRTRPHTLAVSSNHRTEYRRRTSFASSCSEGKLSCIWR